MEKIDKRKLRKVESAVKKFLEALSYDLSDPDLKDTPRRVATLWLKETAVEADPKLFQTFPSDYASMVVLKNHRTFTRCPHHLEKVILDISIGYIPDGKLIGLSKLGRIADYFSKGLMLQEEIAELIVKGLQDALQPKGVAVYIKGQHMCMTSRGIKSYNSHVITTRLTGVFLEDLKAREEFMWTISNT